MPALLSSGNREGTTTSAAYQVPAEWGGRIVTLGTRVPANQDSEGRSITIAVEIAPAVAGPWRHHFGMVWTGNRAGKIPGIWDTSVTWTTQPHEMDQWVRVVTDVPVRTRFAVDFTVDG